MSSVASLSFPSAAGLAVRAQRAAQGGAGRGEELPAGRAAGTDGSDGW